MLNNIRKFSKTIFAKILLVIIIVPFVFWGMGGVFNSGNTNSLAKINNVNISTQDFMNHLNKSGLNSDDIKENLKNNILEKSLTELISNKLLDLEIKDYNFIVSEKILVEKIKNNKIFFDENNKFSRIKYEKFLLYRNITAPEYEKRVKANELKKNLFSYISGGIQSPFFLTNNVYTNEAKKIEIEYINLERIYKSKNDYSTKEINDFLSENENKLKKDYLNFSYVKITPNNLIESDEYNNEFFNKIDEIENKIYNKVKFNEIINQYNLKKTSKKNFIPIDDIESIDNKIYEMRKNSSVVLIDQNEYYLLFQIEKINSKLPNVNNVKFLEDIKKMLFQKGKYDYNLNLLKEINNKLFNDSEFKKIVNNNKNKIHNLTFDSISDNNFFNKDSVKIIYSLPINSYTLIADKNDNVYVAKILKESLIKVSKNDKSLKKYKKQSNDDIKNKMYLSYDNFLNSKYKIKINEKTLERVKNYFK